MTCKINADTTNGLKLESDTSGEIDIQSNGTTSINFSPSQITITDADSNQPRLLLKNTNADSTPPFLDFQKDSSSPADNDVIGKMRFIGDDDGGNTVAYATIVSTSPDVSDGSENGDLRFETTVDGTNAERMRIDSSGNVGIGTSSPSGKLTVSDIGEDNALYVLGGIKQDDGPGNPWYLGKGILGSTGSEFLIGNGSSELLRIEQSGFIGIGVTTTQAHLHVDSEDTASIFGRACIAATTADPTGDSLNQLYVAAFTGDSNVTNATFLSMRDSDGEIGNITANGASSVAYNTSSDYRLKENVNYTFDATTRLKQLRPCRFNFIADPDTTKDGFLAHEVSSIVPEAVTGTHDETRECVNVVKKADGKMIHENVSEEDWTQGKTDGTYAEDTTWSATATVPRYQGIDQSKLVPLLVKTIQELEARITALENN
jgi:hypothetical protein